MLKKNRKQFFLISLSLLSLNLISGLHANSKTAQPRVIEVSSLSDIEKNLPAVINFHQEGCGSCNMFKSEYESLASQYPNINFLSIDSKKHSAIAKKYGVSSTPSFVFLLYTVDTPAYKTVIGRQKKLLTKGLDELSRLAKLKRSPIKDITKLAELENLIKNAEKMVVVEFHAERWCGPCKNFRAHFSALADKHQDHAIFVKIDDDHSEKAIAQKYGITGFPTTLIFKNKEANQPAGKVGGADPKGLEAAIMNK